MIRPNKPHVDGYEDEEDCEGYYDPDEAERRCCEKYIEPSTYIGSYHRCRVCFSHWQTTEETRRKAEWDAKTPEEKAQHEKLIKGLRELDANETRFWEYGKPISTKKDKLQ